MWIPSWLRPKPKPDPIQALLAPEITNHNALDLLCAKYEATYTRTRDVGGTVFVKLHLKNGTVLVGEAKTTVDAVHNLTQIAEKYHAL